MASRQIVTVVTVSPVSIHGDSYLDAVVQTETQAAAGQGMRVRIPSHLLAAARAGDRLEIEFLLGQVTGVRPAAS